MPKYTPPLSFRRSHQRGLTLVELMIAVLLGLLVVAAGMGLLLSNRKTYGTTTAVGRIQENQRVAFELLSADIRSAGDYPCLALSIPGRVVAHVDKASFDETLFNKQRDGLEGEDNGIIIYSSDNERGSYLDASETMGYRYAVVKHDTPEEPVEVFDATLFATRPDSPKNMVVCNADRAVVFNASSVESNNKIIKHEVSAGNCGKAFIFDPNNSENLWNALDTGKCSNTVASKNGRNRYCFGSNAQAGENGCDRAGNSPAFVVSMAESDTKIHWKLQDSKLRRNNEEIIDGVVDMELAYRLHGETDYKSASNVDSKKWGRVDSVHVKITFEATGESGLDKQGTGGQNLRRVMEGYVAIRNKLRNQADST